MVVLHCEDERIKRDVSEEASLSSTSEGSSDTGDVRNELKAICYRAVCSSPVRDCFCFNTFSNALSARLAANEKIGHPVI